MGKYFIVYFMLVLAACGVLPESTPAPPGDPTPQPRAADDPLGDGAEEPPEGYYAFMESPNATPPKVRPPPYRQVSSECPEANDARPHVSANNLCGDLNRGLIPRNPMGQSVNGQPYPFELIRNLTLKFLSRTLPVLRADDTLPRVAHLSRDHMTQIQNNRLERSARSLPLDRESIPSEQLPLEHRSDEDSPRESRKFCDNGGVFLTIISFIKKGSYKTPIYWKFKEVTYEMDTVTTKASWV